MSNTIKYCIIGAGMMGREHIQNILLLDSTQIVALVEPDTQQQTLSLALAPNATVFTTLKEALHASNIDVFVIASPNFTHASILETIGAHDSRPVLVEKPLCTSAEDCKKVLDTYSSYTAPVWVAMEYRYMHAVDALRKKLQDGIVGDVVMISIKEHRFPFLKKVKDWNRFEKYTGGTLVEKCCHFFDLMRLLACDEAVQVYASGAMDVNFKDERYEGKTPDIIDNAYVIVEFRSGKRALLELCMFCDGSYYQEEITVIGNKGKIECKIPGPDRLWAVDTLEDLGHSTGFSGKHRDSILVTSLRSPKNPITETITTDASLQVAGDHHGSTFYQHRKFLDVVRGNGTVEVTVEDGIKAVAMGLAAEQSAKMKNRVEVCQY